MKKFILLVAIIATSPAFAQIADKVYTNAKVYKGGGIFDEAVAIKNGKIIYTGTTNGAAAHINASTCVINLAGKLVLPGLHDVHMHPLEASSSAGGNCLLDNNETNVTNLKNALIACNLTLNPNGWKMASGHTIYALLNHPNPKLVLDSIDNVNPILVMEGTSHSIWVNSAALTLAGITSTTPDPNGGVIKHNALGEPNGLLLDNAGDMLIQMALANNATLSAANYNGLINFGLPEIAKHGITSICEARTYWKRNYIQTWQDVKNNGLLTCRVALAPWLYPSDNDTVQIAAINSLYNNGDSLLKIRQIKVYADGIIHNATAALSAPYDDSLGLPFGSGLNYFTESRLASYIKQLETTGYDFHIHAIGDRGITESLNAIDSARSFNGNIGARHRITHVEMVNPADYTRFQSLNVTADMQVAGDFTQPANWSENDPLIGSVRSNNWVPLKSIKNANARITLSSDWDVSTINPFVGMTNALTRVPQELTNLDDVIKAYTINSAFVMRQENYTGSIDTGKFADIIVVDQDLFTIAPDSIYKTNVLLTLLAGNEVYIDSSVVSSFTCPSIVLGFTFIYTKAEINTNTNTASIFWQVSNEENTSHYEIESSSDGYTFNLMDKVNNDNSNHRYIFVDKKPLNNNIVYYRVKSIQHDGKYEYSKVVAVRNNVKDEMHIYPNPVINDFIIVDIIEDSNIEIRDLNGKLVMQLNNIRSGQRINVQNLPVGNYTLNLINKIEHDHVKSTTFTKVN